jgi:hypothetical protein
LSSGLGKVLILVGFLCFVVMLFFLAPYYQRISSLSLILGVFCFVIGWILSTAQLVGTSLANKIGVLMISVSVLSLTIAPVCLWYREIGQVVPQMSLQEHLHYTGETKYFERIPTGTYLFVTPYAWVSFPLAIFGIIVLIFGLTLKRRYADAAETDLAHRKHFAFAFTLILAGVSFLLLSRVWYGYIGVYAEVMNGKLKVPPAHGQRKIHGWSAQTEETVEYPLYSDFLFTPWFDCSLESNISVPSSNNVTLSIFAGDTGEPIIYVTSNEIRYSRNLEDSNQYIFRIRNTQNQSTSAIMSTKIDSPISQKIMMIGVTPIAVGSAVAIIFAEKELKRSNEKSTQKTT